MKICVPRLPNEAGGSGTFLRNWREWLTVQNHRWTNNLEEDYDVLFINAWQTRYSVAYRHKKRLPNLRVVHRVDGAGWDYGRSDNADWLQRAVSYLADVTIFQSDYCRYSTMQKYNIIQHDGTTIYNPVDIAHYSPLGESHPALPKSNTIRIITVIWSPNRQKGAWRIPPLARENPDLEFVFIGNTVFEDFPPNVKLLSPMAHHDLAKALRSADIFLNLSENDPCPNIVLEAMASGLPVLYVPSGGVPELVGADAGLPITDDFRSGCERILENLAAYRHNARQRTEQHFAKDTIFATYWQTIKNAVRRPMPSRWQHFKALADVQKQWWWDKVNG